MWHYLSVGKYCLLCQSPGAPILQLYSKLPQTSGLKMAIYRYYVSGFWVSGGQGAAGTHISGTSAGPTQMAGGRPGVSPSLCLYSSPRGWLGLPPGMAASGQSPPFHGGTGFCEQG